MEHRRHFVPGNQRGLTLRSLGTVAYIKYNRQLVPLTALLLETVHPCTTALCRTAVVVAVEQSERLAVFVNHLERLHIRMIGGNVRTLLERKAIHAVGCIKHTILKHAIDGEVGLNLVFADVQQFLLHLCRIVEAVVGLEFKVGTFRLLGKLFDSLRLCISLGTILANEVLQESIDIVRRLGHRVFQRIRGVVFVSHQLALLSTQLGNLGSNGEGVVLVCTICTMDRSLEHLFAQLAIVETGKKRLLGGIHNDDSIGSLASSALCVFLTLGDVSFAQSCQLFFLLDPYQSVVGSSL